MGFLESAIWTAIRDWIFAMIPIEAAQGMKEDSQGTILQARRLKGVSWSHTTDNRGEHPIGGIPEIKYFQSIKRDGSTSFYNRV